MNAADRYRVTQQPSMDDVNQMTVNRLTEKQRRKKCCKSSGNTSNACGDIFVCFCCCFPNSDEGNSGCCDCGSCDCGSCDCGSCDCGSCDCSGC